jgi:hypothetical protein
LLLKKRCCWVPDNWRDLVEDLILGFWEPILVALESERETLLRLLLKERLFVSFNP